MKGMKAITSGSSTIGPKIDNYYVDGIFFKRN